MTHSHLTAALSLVWQGGDNQFDTYLVDVNLGGSLVANHPMQVIVENTLTERCEQLDEGTLLLLQRLLEQSAVISTAITSLTLVDTGIQLQVTAPVQVTDAQQAVPLQVINAFALAGFGEMNWQVPEPTMSALSYHD